MARRLNLRSTLVVQPGYNVSLTMFYKNFLLPSMKNSGCFMPEYQEESSRKDSRDFSFTFKLLNGRAGEKKFNETCLQTIKNTLNQKYPKGEVVLTQESYWEDEPPVRKEISSEPPVNVRVNDHVDDASLHATQTGEDEGEGEEDKSVQRNFYDG